MSKTKVVTQQDETNCAVSNWAFLTAYTMGANIVLAGVTILLLKAMVQILECTVIGKLNLGTRLIGAI